MTTEELYDKIDSKLSSMDAKLDTLNAKVERHDVRLETNGREAHEMKERMTRIEAEHYRLSKLVWWILGGGTAAGAGIAKLFM